MQLIRQLISLWRLISKSFVFLGWFGILGPIRYFGRFDGRFGILGLIRYSYAPGRVLPQLSFCHLPLLSEWCGGFEASYKGSRRLVSSFENLWCGVTACLFYCNNYIYRRHFRQSVVKMPFHPFYLHFILHNLHNLYIRLFYTHSLHTFFTLCFYSLYVFCVYFTTPSMC